jgi:hypothetical protein
VATQILALHVGAGHTTTVAAESTIRTLRVTGFAAGASDDPGLRELMQSRGWDRVLCTLPADAAFFRFLEPWAALASTFSLPRRRAAAFDVASSAHSLRLAAMAPTRRSNSESPRWRRSP